jgi:hypothetical protein
VIAVAEIRYDLDIDEAIFTTRNLKQAAPR